MHVRACALLTGAVAVLACAGEARAQDFRLVDEVRFAVLQHDTGVIGEHREDGVDLGVEVLSTPIHALELVGSPRFVAGTLINTDGYTNQVYAGLQAERPLARGVLNPDDTLYVEGMVGVAWHDGKLDVTGTPLEDEWKSHGSRLVFRTGFGVGYRFNEKWSLTATFHHISNADTSLPNEGSNDIGLRLGMKL
ncbi:acyloxyacyl hydrolase [Brevundimonas sp. FT23028]|uniref:acyloxyacyl hydrolase n=1 Tax=Brevundimonas sp. FT23028 TaxID=3393748 RepID=UPI003B58B1D8